VERISEKYRKTGGILMDKELMNWLFATEAVRVSPANRPFWYTSGTIGPYYINTEFLYGSEEKAYDLLDRIDEFVMDKLTCPGNILELESRNYEFNGFYKGIINKIVAVIKNEIPVDEVNYVSGGERRDWFFSLLVAKLLCKPHISIFKDMSAVITHDGKTVPAENLDGGNVLHIADLVTEASSYETAWIPAIQKLGGTIKWSIAVVDRNQGGKDLLTKHGIQFFPLISVNSDFFKSAFEQGLLSKKQLDMLLEYIKDPKEAMEEFLKNNPDFIEKSLKSDTRTRERAELCIRKGIYRNLNVSL